jgi:CheY-like chemotaxis protein
LLELMNHEVRMAHDGLQALDVAEKFRPDIVLLDIGMPKLDGYEAARQIRSQPWGEGMTLVALTGWGQEQDRQRSAAAGFDRHCVKPVDVGVLRDLLDENLTRS